jgi:peptidyl-prolyl cis-trans isomerase C
MFKRLSAVAFAATLSLPVFAEDASTVVATVNGTEITVGHIIVARATLPEQYQQLPDEVLFSGILDQLIQQTVLADSFDGDLPGRVVLSIENETRSLTAAEAIEGIMATAVTPEAVEATYNELYDTDRPGKEYNASHILVETKEAAEEIIADLEEGKDFAVLAQTRSTGPSGPNGGSLGWFGAGAMVPSFEQAVMGLDVGAVSEPVETQFGWHVIKLNETRIKDVPPLDEVRAEIEQKVREDAVTAAIEALVEEADVDKSVALEMNKSIIRDMSLID